ncbi:PAS domain-containing sensor histidine kinase [Granulicella tundricola]|uniref:histidine kinase n=1 Tax=Granulicella tundricola (strain ATCC BAA-1859 / DSM 23138 / MP5ACTX9) TaxID=1198114 RepID=E8X710_GRATM|nr:PAS domain-containing sensor histidine kinase [Granulicella tundricola]ADW71119.1 PAS/PAC sensor signal transduction histidine kinase [Granulicella tundricola MP5ACTX9]
MNDHEVYEISTSFPFGRMDASTSATYLRALIGNSPIAIIALDAQHRYTMCNPAFERLFQYTSKELFSEDLDYLIAGPEMMEEARDLSRRVLQGDKVHTVTQRRRRDGMIVDVELYGIPLVVDGELAGVYGLYQDVTERNKAQTAFRAISDQMDNLQQEERRRIARDLHDSTSQELTVLNWNLARLNALVTDKDEALQRLVQETREIASQCSARIRSASYLLHPPLLGEGGLTRALPWLVEGFEQRSGIQVGLEMSANLGRFRDGVEIAIFRVVQESLTNVLRHSGSAVVQIALRCDEDWLLLSISDEGAEQGGPAVSHEKRMYGVGVSGMRERVEKLGGCFSIDGTKGGTTVMVTIPRNMGVHG